MGRHLGSLIGAIGGLVFVLANATEPSALVLRIVAVAVFVLIVVRVVRGARGPREEPPPARAWRTYVISVVAMVVAFPLGALVLNRVLDRPALVLPWVVLVVGLHFLPFARAFRTRVFTVLGVALVAIGLAGGVAVLLVGATAGSWTGVLAGFGLLAFDAAGTLRAPAPVAA